MGFGQKLEAFLGLNTTEYDAKLKGAKGSMTSFGDTLKKVGGLLGVAFGLREIVNFSKEATRLAAEAEGVRNAFMKIGDAKRVLEDMKKATRGMIEDSDLMTLAVKAKNFNIPLKDLATYLEFATNRAITTGKSVGELTDLIVTGLGRKSSRSFIQLGLSATEVQAAFKESGGMIRLVNKALAEMGPVADTAAVGIEKLAASSKNLTEAWGNWLNKSTMVKNVRSYFTQLLDTFADENKVFAEKLKFLLPFNGNFGLTRPKINVPNMRNGLSSSSLAQLDAMFGGNKEKTPEVIAAITKTIGDLKQELADGEAAIDGFSESQAKDIQIQLKANKVLEDKIKLLTTLKASRNIEEAINKVSTGGLTIPSVGSHGGALAGGPTMPVMSDAQKAWVASWKQATDEVTSMISDAFIGVFESIGKGSFEGFGDSLLRNFGSFIAQFGKMLVAMGSSMLLALTLMKAPSIPTAIAAIAAGGVAMAIGGVMMGMASKQSGSMGSGGGGGGYSSSQGNMTVQVEGVLKGKDIYWSAKRFVEDNQ